MSYISQEIKDQKNTNLTPLTQDKNQSLGIYPNRILNEEKYNQFKEVLQCKLCFKLLNNPYDCAICGNSFCLYCITKQKENSMPCPFNCDEESFTVKPSSFGIINILNSLKFNCINKESGCEKEISYNELKEHDLLCNFASVRCPNTNCNEIIRRSNLEYHIGYECHSSSFKCDICKADFFRSEFLNHYNTCKIISSALNPTDKNYINSDIFQQYENYSNSKSSNLKNETWNMSSINSNNTPLISTNDSQSKFTKGGFEDFMDSVQFKNINFELICLPF